MSAPALTPNELYLQEFEALVRSRRSTYNLAILSGVGIQVPGELRLLRGVLRFSRDSDSDAKNPSEDPQDYGTLFFFRSTFSVERALEFVREASTTGSSVVAGGYHVRCGPLPNPYIVGGIPHPDWPEPIGPARIFDWPSRDFTWSAGGQNVPDTLRDPYGILISTTLSPVIRPTQAIDDWTGLPWANRISPSANLLYIVTPEFRARVRSVLITDMGLEIEIDGTLADSGRLLFQATAGDRGREGPLEVRPQDGHRVVVPISKPASTFHFFILEGNSGQLLDWVEFDVEGPVPRQIRYESLGLRVAQLLEGGETQFVEWKNAVGEAGAIGEFFESVTAFANSNSGTILVGVENSGDVVGLQGQTPDSVRNRIVDLAETRCEPVPEGIQFQEAEFAGKRVLIMSVPKGGNPPTFYGGTVQPAGLRSTCAAATRIARPVDPSWTPSIKPGWNSRDTLGDEHGPRSLTGRSYLATRASASLVPALAEERAMASATQSPEPLRTATPTEPATSRLRTITGSRWPRKFACG